MSQTTSQSVLTEKSYSVILPKQTAKSKFGVGFTNSEDKNDVIIKSIAPDSVAASSDLKLGDKVVSVNGEPIQGSGKTAKETAAILSRAPPGGLEIVASYDEETPLLHESVEKGGSESASYLDDGLIAEGMSGMLGLVIAAVQVVAAAAIFMYFDYGEVGDFTTQQYIIFRDIMVMLLLGFGYLMTFLEKYGLSAVGLTMLLTALNMECNILAECYLTGSLKISMESIINAEFSAAALLISFGALIGRANPLQMCVISIAEAIFYTLNKVFIVFGILKAEDVGGTITIHMFGAFFGLAASKALGPQTKDSMSNNAASRVSDVFSLVGTTLLWVYWPSFVGATETGDSKHEMHCLINTIMSLVGSTGAAFFLSQYLNEGKFDAVHIQNSTLAGGVAIGATARLAMGPGVSFIVGLGAGTISVLGYFYSSPLLEDKLGLFDTCGVGNLHGYPSVFGGLMSVLLVFLDSNANFLNYGVGTQSIIQLLAVVATLIVSIVTGYLTGMVVFMNEPFADVPDYEDLVWWIGE